VREEGEGRREEGGMEEGREEGRKGLRPGDETCHRSANREFQLARTH
jgi:hypothetical protein